MSTQRQWLPRVTVAAVIERDGRFLMVEELDDERAVFNQPAGHWEDGETLAEAVVREVREETAWAFAPRELLGLYRWRTGDGVTYLRVTFCGELGEHDGAQPLDTGILATHWLSRPELEAHRARLRTPLVMHCIDDYLRGTRYSLALLKEIG